MWSPDDPLTLAAAGSKAKMQIWDVGANFSARKVFGTRLAEAGRTIKDKKSGGIISVADDEDENDNDDEED
jgi:periodic tryptophan protein 1